MGVSLFYLIHPAYSNLLRIVENSTVETTTDQRPYIIRRDKPYISSKKRVEMQFILFDESR